MLIVIVTARSYTWLFYLHIWSYELLICAEIELLAILLIVLSFAVVISTMQPGKEQSAASRATSQRKRSAYHNAMKSKTAGLLGISSSKPSSSPRGAVPAVDSSQLAAGTTPSTPETVSWFALLKLM